MAGEALDWREMFKRYIDRVAEEEGVDFLYETDWTAQEWAAIRQADAEPRRS